MQSILQYKVCALYTKYRRHVYCKQIRIQYSYNFFKILYTLYNHL